MYIYYQHILHIFDAFAMMVNETERYGKPTVERACSTFHMKTVGFFQPAMLKCQRVRMVRITKL